MGLKAWHDGHLELFAHQVAQIFLVLLAEVLQ
jgi:hypothetical protein